METRKTDSYEDLREQIKKAFSNCFGYELYLSDYIGNTFFTSLSLLIKFALRREDYNGIPKEGWFIKFLNKKQPPFHPSKIQLIREFLKAYELAPFKIIDGMRVDFDNNNSISKTQFANGTRLIDQNFVQEIESIGKTPSYSDFYLAKNENDCQWYGVIKDWDIKRGQIEEIKNRINGCFDWYSKIVAVVWGPGGTGKSTLLRGLALELIDKNYKTLWLTDLEEFYNALLTISVNCENLLVIIDDWPSLLGDVSLLNRFLNRVLNYKNIRLIIGDRDQKFRTYHKHVYENNYFQIQSVENQQIIEKVLKYTKWANNINDITHFDGPLFIVLFILGRINDNPEYSNTKQVYSLFQDIVDSDNYKIFEAYPGLAKVIFYWLTLIQQYNIIMTWRNLLQLADIYEGNFKTSTELINFNPNKEVCQILSNYFSFTQFHYLYDDEDYILEIHHELLQKALSHKIIPHWFVDDEIKFEILNKLINNEQFDLASDLYWFLRKDRNVKFEEMQKKYFKSIFDSQFASIVLKIWKTRRLNRIYEHINLAKTEKDWEDVLIEIVIVLNTDREKAFPYIFSSLISNGCKAKCIKTAYEHSSTIDGCNVVLETWAHIGITENRGLPTNLSALLTNR
ncbi:MAG: hypothetical protein JWP94_2948 [Mucilaginibacter sp.]|nr:hypothetical protein [Mucilaginibacter sp.]